MLLRIITMRHLYDAAGMSREPSSAFSDNTAIEYRKMPVVITAHQHRLPSFNMTTNGQGYR